MNVRHASLLDVSDRSIQTGPRRHHLSHMYTNQTVPYTGCPLHRWNEAVPFTESQSPRRSIRHAARTDPSIKRKPEGMPLRLATRTAGAYPLIVIWRTREDLLDARCSGTPAESSGPSHVTRFLSWLHDVPLVAESARVYEALLSPGTQGTWIAAVATQFTHHPWNGLHFWDLVQPFFMFIVGVAMPFSFTRRWAGGETFC